MGPRGARVRCPDCKRPFVVLREEADEVTAPAESLAASQPERVDTETATLPPEGLAPAWSGDGERPPDAEASRIAEELLDALATSLGGALTQARSRGRVLAEFGPDVMKAFEEYRSRLGERAEPAAFRAALKDRWNIDLAT
jgi:hypothetical protein